VFTTARGGFCGCARGEGPASRQWCVKDGGIGRRLQDARGDQVSHLPIHISPSIQWPAVSIPLESPAAAEREGGASHVAMGARAACRPFRRFRMGGESWYPVACRLRVACRHRQLDGERAHVAQATRSKEPGLEGACSAERASLLHSCPSLVLTMADHGTRSVK
jgi:hypothetical protein